MHSTSAVASASRTINAQSSHAPLAPLAPLVTPPVRAALDNLDSDAALLEANLHELAARLDSVLGPELVEAQGTAIDQGSYLVGVADEVSAVSTRARRMNSLVLDLLKRLGL